MKSFIERCRQSLSIDMSGESSAPFFYGHRVITWPLSQLFVCAVKVRSWLFDQRIFRSHQLPGMTISIGNIALGGTGKSPIVMEVVRELVARGARCAVLTRGYGSTLSPKDSIVIRGGLPILPSSVPTPIPDEAMMQSVALPDVPVIIGRNRWEAACRFIKSGIAETPTHWILDDGFQHRRLARDLDIVLLDALSPFGNGHLIPRGNLREQPQSLSRADLVLLTRSSTHQVPTECFLKIRKYFEGPLLAVPFRVGVHPECVTGDGIIFDRVVHAPVAAVCGIARPQLFADQLVRQGVSLSQEYFVGDHASLDRKKLLDLADQVAAIVTTAKDYYRDPAKFAHLRVPVFIQEMRVDFDTPGLETLIKACLDRPS